MTKAIVLRAPGGPEALLWEEVSVGAPGPGQIRGRHEAIGVNFHDVYVRSGLYQTLPLPGIPGLEAAGTVTEVGEGVTDFVPGDRIAYVAGNYGGYTEERLLDAALAVRVPDGIPAKLAATILLKGLTAAVLATRVHPVKAGDVTLVHAAAGGVGRLLSQWLASLGAHVIGTVGSPDKAEIARAHGCREVILYREEDLVARVMEITGGRGAGVVYDAIGRDTFDRSLAALAMRGHLVNYGQASGSIPPFEISRLGAKSASITRPMYGHYVEDRVDLIALSDALWARVLNGSLMAEPGIPFPLGEASAAHRALEDRVAGALILVP